MGSHSQIANFTNEDWYAMPLGWRENPVFKPEPHTEREAYIWLDGNRGASGELLVSLGALKIEWSWASTGAVRAFLSRIRDAGLIDFDSLQSPILILVPSPYTYPSRMPEGIPDFSLSDIGERRVRSGERRPGIPTAIARAVYERDGGTCVYCGAHEGRMHLDHVKPWSKGGLHSVNNLCVSCANCNMSKGAKTLEDWLASND